MKFGESRTRPPHPRQHGGARCAVVPLWPPRWRTLFPGQANTLWLPLPDAPSDSRGIRHFIPDAGNALYARALLCASRMFPQARALPEVTLPAFLRRLLSFELPVAGPWRAVMRIGVSGPRQKAVVLFSDPDGEALAFVKVATAAAADADVLREANWLRELACHPQLTGQVPELLAEGCTRTGRRYLAVTPASGTATARSLTRNHARFVGALARSHLEVGEFAGSSALRQLKSMVLQASSCVEYGTVLGLRAALRECVAAVGNWQGPFVMAHGDFRPANVRNSGERLFAFDWEDAHAGANPLCDLLHYQLAPRAASGRTLEAGTFKAALHAAARHAREMYSEWRWSDSVVAGLGMAYLLHQILSRSLARQCYDGSDPMIRSYSKLLEQRTGWAPGIPTLAGSVHF